MASRNRTSLIDPIIDQASTYVEAVRPHLETAMETAVETARERALPLLQDARDRATPYVAEARDRAVPLITSGAARAAGTAAVGASLAAEKASSARDQLAASRAARDSRRGPQATSHRRRPNGWLLLASLAAAALTALAWLARRWRSDRAADNWQAYVPTPPPTAPGQTDNAAREATPTDDPGGAGPDEALADEAESPHPPTTPDQPAQVISLEDAPHHHSA